MTTAPKAQRIPTKALKPPKISADVPIKSWFHQRGRIRRRTIPSRTPDTKVTKPITRSRRTTATRTKGTS